MILKFIKNYKAYTIFISTFAFLLASYYIVVFNFIKNFPFYLIAIGGVLNFIFGLCFLYGIINYAIFAFHNYKK